MGCVYYDNNTLDSAMNRKAFIKSLLGAIALPLVVKEVVNEKKPVRLKCEGSLKVPKKKKWHEIIAQTESTKVYFNEEPRGRTWNELIKNNKPIKRTLYAND